MKITNKTLRLNIRLLLVVCTALLTSCGGGSSSGGGDTSATANSGIPGLTGIVIVADSIGTGAGVVASSSAFPALIRSMVNVPVTDDSVPGRQVSSGVASARALIASQRPSHIIVLLGTNDANNGNPSSAISGLRTIADIANSAGVIPIIGTLPRFTRDSAANARAGQISGGIRGINARIVEIRGALAPSDISSDGFHPNANGQQIIASLFINAL